MSEKLYRVQIDNDGMPNFSTAEEVESCKDAISRQWLIDNIEKGEEVKGGVFDTDSDSVKNFINVAPPVTVESKQGEWIYCEEDDSHLPEDGRYGIFKCSNCESKQSFPISEGSGRVYGDNYCSSCGAHMKGATDE